jgi:RNA polymerase sigma-70 factor (ECF subfamily)
MEAEVAMRIDADAEEGDAHENDAIPDDRLRLIFTCCHPALAPDARIALTLREVCGLTTEEIARAFLVPTTTVAQRIVRAKARIRDERLPYAVPEPAELPARRDAVLRAIYLVFNEGYSASSGATVTRADLSGEAIRLGRLLVELLPEAEARGLLALMLLQESRRAARTSPEGDLVLLPDQDRSLWDRSQIAEGRALAAAALGHGNPGPYALQAAIAAVHSAAERAEDTDWGAITRHYAALERIAPSPVVALNHAAAIAMAEGPAAGLARMDALAAGGELATYHLFHAARADLFRRMGGFAEAEAAYRDALALVRQEPERRFLERRLAEVREAIAAA